tara:strand:+ start:212 stop:424 length:213 start_codon:yes stop_codon:yes gene_type:complete
MNITLKHDQVLTVTLPDGQTIEIDTRDHWQIDVHHLDKDGDCVSSIHIDPVSDDEPHPSLSAAERNPNLR